MPATLQSGLKAPAGERPGRKGKGLSLLVTASLWALLLFVCLNAALWIFAGKDKAESKDPWRGPGAVDITVQGYSALKSRPDVVLIGSSLMMYPFWAMDKERDGSIGDIFHHPYSHLLEDRLAAEGIPGLSTYNLASFGEMASDSYLYVDQLLKGDKKPRLLLYGVAPRDFSDYDVLGPMSTFTFKRLVNLQNFPHYAALYLPEWQDKADFVTSHICYFYGKRWRLQHDIDRGVQKLYAFLGLSAPDQPAAKPAKQAGFMMSGNADERWSTSIVEYRRRYRTVEGKSLPFQLGFLERILALCKERGIKVVMVNMPLSDDNRALLPGGFYEGFRKRVADIAALGGAQFLDLGTSKNFVTADYWDTSHLNHLGGHKLVKDLLPLLKADLAPAR